MIPAEFFFLRPLWLLALIPVLALVWIAARRSYGQADSGWRNHVDPHLLNALVVPPVDGVQSGGWWRPAALGLGLSAAVLAMAGPTWQRIELPTFQTKEPVVVVLSLAQSMNTDDVRPSRLVRAGHKLRDILERTKGGDTGFVVYSDVPFVAAPLTSDGAVIAEMLPELSTDLMPTLGNRPDYAIKEATGLLKRAGATRGRIVLLADTAGSDPEATKRAAKAARDAGYSVHVIGVGANSEGALRTAAGRTIAGQNGKPLPAVFDPDGLREIARSGGGTFAGLTPGPDDINQVLAGIDATGDSSAMVDDIQADTWADMGYWLLLVPVFLAPLAFRRNLLMCAGVLATVFALNTPTSAQAFEWRDLWLTPDQQGLRAFEKSDFETAAEHFEDPRWRAAAQFRAGNYPAAAQTLTGRDDFDARYNQATALARSGALEEALAAYERLLEERPDDADTLYNRDLVARLLEKMQQQDQQSGGEQQQDQQSGGEQQQDQQSGGEQQQDQQAGGEQQQDQQAGGEQQQDQQSGGEQQQDQQAGGEQQQDQQAGGEQQQDQQAGGEQQQDQQAGGEQQQDQQSGGEQQQGQQAGGEQQQDQQAGGEQQQDQQAGELGQSANTAQDDGRGAFERAMDAILGGNGEDEPAATRQDETADRIPEAATAGGLTEQDQAIEQMLRRVPDDASGLLRARIRQHYQERR